MLLYTALNSAKFAALIIANVPFAIIGGVFGLWISGQYLFVPSLIGFIIEVLGVTMLNGIVLMSFINELRSKGQSVAEAVRRGCELRLRPVLMTASVAILGPGAHAALPRRGRGDTATTSHGRARRLDHLDPAHADFTAGHLRMAGNQQGEWTMKEIKAYLHRRRVADVIHALEGAGSTTFVYWM